MKVMDKLDIGKEIKQTRASSQPRISAKIMPARNVEM